MSSQLSLAAFREQTMRARIIQMIVLVELLAFKNQCCYAFSHLSTVLIRQLQRSMITSSDAPFSRSSIASINDVVGNARSTSRRGMPSLLYSQPTTKLFSTALQPSSLPIHFISDPMQLFIEDTDAYGVMYNGNYIKSYERALHQFHLDNKKCQQNKNMTNNKDDQSSSSSVLVNHSNFYLTHVTSHRFKASPPLGSDYIIVAKQVIPTEQDVDENIPKEEEKMNEEEVPVVKEVKSEQWSLEMIKFVPELEQKDETTITKTKQKVYNTALVTVAKPLTAMTKNPNPIQPFETFNNSFKSTFILHRDEFDIAMPQQLPIRTALNLFERSRTMALGGPDELRKMKDADNLMWVVSSIDDMEIDCSGHCTSNSVWPGQVVSIESNFRLKRKGMIVECEQQVLLENSVLAKGVITLCAVDATRMRPTSKIPDHVCALFQT